MERRVGCGRGLGVLAQLADVPLVGLSVLAQRQGKLVLLDRDMQWRVEPGAFEVMVGSSSVQCQTVTLNVVG